MQQHDTRIATSGFSLVEVVVVGMIISVLFLLSTQSLFRGRQTTSFTEVTNQLVRDVREAQVWAMQGVVPTNGALLDYSVRFEQDRYVVFPGVVFDSESLENRTVLLEPMMQFSTIRVANNTVTFARGSGDVRDFISGFDSVVLWDKSTNFRSRIWFNNRGVVFVNKE